MVAISNTAEYQYGVYSKMASEKQMAASVKYKLLHRNNIINLR